MRRFWIAALLIGTAGWALAQDPAGYPGGSGSTPTSSPGPAPTGTTPTTTSPLPQPDPTKYARYLKCSADTDKERNECQQERDYCQSTYSWFPFLKGKGVNPGSVFRDCTADYNDCMAATATTFKVCMETTDPDPNHVPY